MDGWMENIIADYLEKCLCVYVRSVWFVQCVFTRCDSLPSASLLNPLGSSHQLQVFILINPLRTDYNFFSLLKS